VAGCRSRRTCDAPAQVTAVSSLRKGDLPSARRFLQRAEEAHRAVGLHNPTPMINLGWVLRLEGDEAGAAGAFRRALRESRRIGNRPDIPEPDEARAHLGDTDFEAEYGRERGLT
jgi:hypothetical protein